MPSSSSFSKSQQDYSGARALAKGDSIVSLVRNRVLRNQLTATLGIQLDPNPRRLFTFNVRF